MVADVDPDILDSGIEMPRDVALTFDVEFPDRPGWQVDNLERLLAVLAGEGVRATFFLQGQWVQAHPLLARQIAEQGHALGNHSFSHCNYRWLTPEGMRADVQQAESAIRTATGRDPRPWFRLPYGAGQREPQIRALLAELGYRAVAWNVDARDWDPTRSAHDLVQAVQRQSAGVSPAVVLLHGWPAVTAAALPALIGSIRAGRGRFCSFLTTGESTCPTSRSGGLPPLTSGPWGSS